ncbi:MAG TPA: plastocyanin/azurin family copper-binding protein [Verrucomicrobiae bacterium]|nr:plastocyanin/azurin family copper-binding protein [Verrucomicrobiae bacterium]
MKNFVHFAFLAGLVLATTLARPAVGATYVVQMTSADRFTPPSLSVGVGDTVIWTNTSASTHTSTSGTAPTADGHWSSSNVSAGKTFSFTFTNVPPQSYAYFCQFHFPFGMVGTLTITNATITPASLENPLMTNGQFQFFVNGKAATTYLTEVSSDFTRWVAIQTNVAASDRFLVSDPAPTTHMNFYRVREVP